MSKQKGKLLKGSYEQLHEVLDELHDMVKAKKNPVITPDLKKS
jgi:hypothetical protein